MKIVYIIGAIAYFLFTIYKKNKESQQEVPINNSDNQENDSWGMDDLISQFEQKYGVEKESVQDAYNPDSYQSDSYDVTQYDEKIPVQEPEELNSPEYSSENADHHAFGKGASKKSETGDYRNALEDDKRHLELPNLEQMIISKTILERPDYN